MSKAYIPCAATAIPTSEIVILNLATNTVSGTIPFSGGSAWGIAITPDGTKAYVVAGVAVHVIDTATNAVITTIAIPSASGFPQKIAITPDSAKAYIADPDNNSVAVIDCVNNTYLTTITSTDWYNPYYIAFNGTQAYFSNDDANSIVVVDTVSDTVTSTITMTSPRGIIFSADGTKAYVGNDTSPGTVSVMSIPGWSLLSTLSVEEYASCEAISPDGSKVYVVCLNPGYALVIYIINTSTDTVSGTTIPIPNTTRGNVAFSPDGTSAYVAQDSSLDNNFVLHIDATTDTYIGTVTIGPSTTYAYGGFAVVQSPTNPNPVGLTRCQWV